MKSDILLKWKQELIKAKKHRVRRKSNVYKEDVYTEHWEDEGEMERNVANKMFFTASCQ